MCAKGKWRWNVQQRDALGIVVLALLVIIIRMLFAPAPVVLPAPADFGQEQRAWGREWERRGPEDVAPIREDARGSNEARSGGPPALPTPFAFDPNTLDSAGFRRLGFSAAQVASLLRYRASGAVFRKPEDFSRAYVVSDEMYLRLAPYIRIQEQVQSQPQGQAQRPPQASTPASVPTSDPMSDLASEAWRPPAASPQRERIEINGADTSRLQRLRGIGPYYAQRIVQYRERLGGFVSAEQLMEVDGMDAARFEMMEPQIEINYALIRKIDLKTADQSLLGQHPYIGPYAARWIVHYREQLGDTVCTLPSLLRRNIIKPQQAQWLEYYVE